MTDLLIIGASVAVPVLFVWACQEEVRHAERERARKLTPLGRQDSNELV